MSQTMPETLPAARLLNELQSFGARVSDPGAGAASRRGGAGPTDHKALTIDGVTIMVPVHTESASASPYFVGLPDAQGASRISRESSTAACRCFTASR